MEGDAIPFFLLQTNQHQDRFNEMISSSKIVLDKLPFILYNPRRPLKIFQDLKDIMTGPTIEVNETLNQILPLGIILPFAGAVLPSAAWLWCDGAAISRTTYASLYVILGDVWGAGDGATTFNKPDMRGVFLKGAGTTNRALGKDANGNFYAGILGTFLQDKLQGHRHTPLAGANQFFTNAAGLVFANAGAVALNQQATTGDPTTDTTNGPPRTGLTTEPQSAGVNFIIHSLVVPLQVTRVIRPGP